MTDAMNEATIVAMAKPLSSSLNDFVIELNWSSKDDAMMSNAEFGADGMRQ